MVEDSTNIESIDIAMKETLKRIRLIENFLKDSHGDAKVMIIIQVPGASQIYLPTKEERPVDNMHLRQQQPKVICERDTSF